MWRGAEVIMGRGGPRSAHPPRAAARAAALRVCQLRFPCCAQPRHTPRSTDKHCFLRTSPSAASCNPFSTPRGRQGPVCWRQVGLILFLPPCCPPCAAPPSKAGRTCRIRSSSGCIPVSRNLSMFFFISRKLVPALGLPDRTLTCTPQEQCTGTYKQCSQRAAMNCGSGPGPHNQFY